MDSQNSPTSNSFRRFATASTGARVGGVLDLAVPESPQAEEHEMEHATDTQASTRGDVEQQSNRSVHVEQPSASEPEPAGEVISVERSEGLLPQVNQRLEAMEESQKRMEDLLLQLMTELREVRAAT
jgi:hypothetical protein